MLAGDSQCGVHAGAAAPAPANDDVQRWAGWPVHEPRGHAGYGDGRWDGQGRAARRSEGPPRHAAGRRQCLPASQPLSSTPLRMRMRFFAGCAKCMLWISSPLAHAEPRGMPCLTAVGKHGSRGSARRSLALVRASVCLCAAAARFRPAPRHAAATGDGMCCAARVIAVEPDRAVE